MKMPSDAATGREEFRRGWPTVSACLLGNVIGLHILPPYTVGLFMEPLMDEFGWSRIAVSLGITTITLGTAVAAPLTGLLTGRFGERVLIAFGSLALAIGYLALSLMNGSLTLYYAIMLLMALFGAGC